MNIEALEEKDLIKNEDISLIFTKDEASNSYFHILEEGEYFIYPDSNMLNLFVLGSGTKLEININETRPYPFEKVGENYILRRQQPLESNIQELEDAIVNESIKTFENSFKWEKIDFRFNNLNIVESSMTTYLKDDTFKYGQIDSR